MSLKNPFQNYFDNDLLVLLYSDEVIKFNMSNHITD
jgi:hypothetical protein